MIRAAASRQKGFRRVALVLVACALLVRLLVPAGWMPEARANGVTLGWCSGSGDPLPAEAQAMIARAMGTAQDQAAPKHKPAPDQPCAFAAAAQAVAVVDPIPTLAPPCLVAEAPAQPLVPVPGQGLVAPPPFATGPPFHA
jgi:hypothetical protein